jgi:hypothetical protein
MTCGRRSRITGTSSFRLEQVCSPKDSLTEHIAGDGASFGVVRHAGIPISAVAAEADEVGHTEDLHGQFEFAQPVCPEIVVLLRSQVRETLDQHLALFPERAGHETDRCALGHVLGHGYAIHDRLIVRMGEPT